MNIINWKEALLPYEQAVNELTIKFNSLRKEFNIAGFHSPIESVDGRVKSVASILDKCNKKNVNVINVFEELEDIAGVRIICRFVEDIEKVVNLIRKRSGNDLTIVEEEDYIRNTKKSGYRSYHITIKYPIITKDSFLEVFVELQIRTLSMNFWSTIEHSLRYKYNGNMPEDVENRLKTCAEASFLLDNEMATIREELIEAQGVAQTRENLVNDILKSIANLHSFAKLEEINNLHREFINIYQTENVEKLSEFSKKLITIAQVYKVDF